MTFKMALPMGMRFLLSSIAFISINSCCLGLHDDAFHEELFIKPLPTGHIYTHFQFTTTWDVELKRKDECKTIRGIAWGRVGGSDRIRCPYFFSGYANCYGRPSTIQFCGLWSRARVEVLGNPNTLS